MKTKKQLQEMTADEVVNYLLANHKLYRLKYREVSRRRYYADIYQIAGFELAREVVEPADEWEDDGLSIYWSIKNLKTGKKERISNQDGERLYNIFNTCLKKRQQRCKNFHNIMVNKVVPALPIALFAALAGFLMYNHYTVRHPKPKQVKRVEVTKPVNSIVLSQNTAMFECQK
ncbi:MAG: hypothetical protein J5613_03515 [Alphaproteobacteria bacterium]|nr:hypothetical protein [Alphaproteobacteria bacterium]